MCTKAAIFLCAVLTLLTSTAYAHESDDTHRVIANVATSPKGLQVQTLLMMQIPAGERATRLKLQADLDKNGKLNELEAGILADNLSHELVGGYVLRYADKGVPPADAKARATIDQDGGILLALLFIYQLPAPTPGHDKLSIHVLATPRGSTTPSPGLVAEIQVQPPLQMGKSSHPRAKDAPVVGPATLSPGGPGVWIELQTKQDSP